MRNFKWRSLAEAELWNFKSHYIVQICGTSSHRLFCVRKQNSWTSRHIIFLVRKRNCGTSITEYTLCGGGTAGLKVKALYGSGTAKLQVVINLLYGRRSCVTSKPQYIPCAEAELRNFRASSHTLFFKSQYIPCAEAEIQAKEYSMCGSGTAELQDK